MHNPPQKLAAENGDDHTVDDVVCCHVAVRAGGQLLNMHGLTGAADVTVTSVMMWQSC